MDNYFNAVCSVCGKKYHVCQSCQNTGSFVPWRTVADSPSCYKIFQILSSHTNHQLADAQARALLQRCNLTELDTFLPEIKDTIMELLDKQESNSSPNTNLKSLSAESILKSPKGKG